MLFITFRIGKAKNLTMILSDAAIVKKTVKYLKLYGTDASKKANI